MKMVVLDGYTLNPGDLDWGNLKKYGGLTVYDRTAPGDVVNRARDAEILFTNKTPVTKDDLDRLPNLKCIGVLAVGYDIVDIKAAGDLGIVVTNCPTYGTRSVAQLTFALLLELCHHVQRHSDTVTEGKWSRSEDFSYWDYPLIELAGKTMGIIGFGRIGRRVGQLAHGFGMNVLANDRNRTAELPDGEYCWAEIPELLRKADVVSLHCPLTPESEGIINRESLAAMKRTAFLINTSRGPLVCDQDLADALNDGTIAGAGLDVLSVEPPPSGNPLFGAKNCLITPHIAWATAEARSRLMEVTISNLESFLNGKPVNQVN